MAAERRVGSGTYLGRGLSPKLGRLLIRVPTAKEVIHQLLVFVEGRLNLPDSCVGVICRLHYM
jgi:hypothetical protein